MILEAVKGGEYLKKMSDNKFPQNLYGQAGLQGFWSKLHNALCRDLVLLCNGPFQKNSTNVAASEIPQKIIKHFFIAGGC